MNGETWITLAQVVGGLLGGGALVEVVRAVGKRRPQQVASHVQLNQATLEWAKKLEESADRAWQRAEEAERKAEAANGRADEADYRADQAERRAENAERAVARVQAQVNDLSSYMSRVLRLIADPDMTMDRLREAVGDGPVGGAL